MIMNALQGLKSDSSEGHHYRGLDQLDGALQKVRTVSDFGRTWPAIGAGRRLRITQRRARNEDLVATQTDRLQETIEVASRLIARKGNTRPVSALASRRFADKHDPRINGAIQMAQHRGALCHPRTANTRGRFCAQ